MQRVLLSWLLADGYTQSLYKDTLTEIPPNIIVLSRPPSNTNADFGLLAV